MIRVDIITLFPAMFSGPFEESIVKRARTRGLVQIRLFNLRDFTTDNHRTVDDRPYGGGAGMVLKPEPLVDCIERLRTPNSQVILFSPAGAPLVQATAARLALQEHLILICGHYEGVDDRVRQLVVTEELSIGDYVLSNGNLAAMVLTDAIVRLLPGALGCDQSTTEESFSQGLLEYPQYTRPEEFRGLRVPDVLLSGHHLAIAAWRRQQSLDRTRARRPDLLAHPPATDGDRAP